MRKKSLQLGALLILCCTAGAAQATQYPGPGGGVDTLIKVDYIQNPAAVPHPVSPDTVWGIGGIITGFDNFPTGFGFYIQNSQGGAYSGVDVFTGANAYNDDFSPQLALGDSVFCYGRMDEFLGLTELRGFNASPFAGGPIVRRISTGNPLPPFHVGTVNELRLLPTNPNGELWEGCLVKIREKMRVARTQFVGALNGSSQILVANSCVSAVCDSVFIDGSTLSFNIVGVGPLGALVDSVQGIYGNVSSTPARYTIQLRDANDIFDPQTPPSISDAYFITPDTIRVIFDHNVTQASGNNTANYTIGSTLGPPTSATRQVKNNMVHLKVTPGTTGAAQSVTVSNIVSTGGQAMVGAQPRSLYEGIVSIAMVQAPQPDSLAKIPCEDRSAFAGTGGGAAQGAFGNRITIRGVCVAAYTGGQTYFLETAGGGLRSGITVFGPIQNLLVGHQYVLAGAIQEFFAETEFASNVYVKDEGVVAIPAPAVQTVGVLRNNSCDATQSVSNAEDYEDMLVKVVNVTTTEERNPGQSFFVAGPYPSNPDTILIDNNMTRTFDPVLTQRVDVTGILELAGSVNAGSNWRIQPRGNSDVIPTQTASVGDNPDAISFAVAPNPARSARVTFALPHRDQVRIAVYDLAGRLRSVLADGEFPAGTHTLSWNGRDMEGNKVGSGVYFYKLRIAGQELKQRGVLLN
jgi:hypothetical protein